MAIDQAKQDEFLGRFVADLGAVFAAPAVVAGAGFGRVRRATETPFNRVFEARP